MKQLQDILLNVQKPARYVGGELNSVIKDKDVDLRFAFCFPDTYEIGMSHLGMKILYSLLNERSNIWCERVFAPWMDFRQELLDNAIPLYALESFSPLYEFDIIGFTLQFELSYTNILYMLDLGGVPLFASERTELKNLVVVGGPCACNVEPLVDFIDLAMLGEGEEVILELSELYIECKKMGSTKTEFLHRAAMIEGVYVPSLYDVSYNNDGTVCEIIAKDNAPKTIKKRIINDMNAVYFPENFVVPFIEIVHDRSVVELMRGCIRGCRFCQAGFIYRPLREKSPQVLCKQGKALCESTGYEEISLSSLSTSDYPHIKAFLNDMISYSDTNRINLSLPSLRIDNFDTALLERIQSIRKSGLTFAPEAGSQRLRDVINKNVSEEEVLRSCRLAFDGGYSSVKLYFMMGLPTETIYDIEEIIHLAQMVVGEFSKASNRDKGKGVMINVSVSTFVPKPFTPFQWVGQDSLELIKEKQKALVMANNSRKISVKYHDSKTSIIEAVLARGDRRLGAVLLNVYKNGGIFDGWDECFSYDRYSKALDECGLTAEFYANRNRSVDEVLPWSHLDYFVSDKFLWREYQKSIQGEVTENCKQKCSGCGVNIATGIECNKSITPVVASEFDMVKKYDGEIDYIMVRARYSKLKRAKYISHLDIMRTFGRALKRSLLPIWYSQGFNPHIYTTFAMPLSLGVESMYEVVDFRLTECVDFGIIKEQLNESLPPDIRIIDVFAPIQKTDDIKNCIYSFKIIGDKEKFIEFLSQPEILVEKKSKKGINIVDVKPDCELIEIGETLVVKMKITSGIHYNINPNLLFTVLEQQTGIKCEQVVKELVLDKDDKCWG